MGATGALALIVGCWVFPIMVCGARTAVVQNVKPAARRRRVSAKSRGMAFFLFTLAALWVWPLAAWVSIEPGDGLQGLTTLAIASLGVATLMLSVGLCDRDPATSTVWETIEYATRLAFVLLVPAWFAFGLLRSLLPITAAAARWALPFLGFACFAAVLFAPVVALVLRAFPSVPETPRVAEERGVRVARLLVPSPGFVHVASLPWLRLLLITDALWARLSRPQRDALVALESSPQRTWSTPDWARWAWAAVVSGSVFAFGVLIAEDQPRKLAATVGIASFVSFCVIWRANRRRDTALHGLLASTSAPHVSHLASALKQLASSGPQLFPATTRTPIDDGLYDRLYALGLDPGTRPSDQRANLWFALAFKLAMMLSVLLAFALLWLLA